MRKDMAELCTGQRDNAVILCFGKNKNGEILVIDCRITTGGKNTKG